MSIEADNSTCFELLVNLKGTIESLLSLPNTNVWNMYGGLDRLASSLQTIFKHGLKVDCHYWSFVRELRFENPVLGPFLDEIMRECDYGQQDAGLFWLHKSLQALNLSSQLLFLFRDNIRLSNYYYEYAFLRQSNFFSALITCLKAIELNKAFILTGVNPHAMLKVHKNFKPGHVRSHSLPVARAATDSLIDNPTNDAVNINCTDNVDRVNPLDVDSSKDQSDSNRELKSKFNLPSSDNFFNQISPSLVNPLLNHSIVTTSSLGSSIVSSLSNLEVIEEHGYDLNCLHHHLYNHNDFTKSSDNHYQYRGNNSYSCNSVHHLKDMKATTIEKQSKHRHINKIDAYANSRDLISSNEDIISNCNHNTDIERSEEQLITDHATTDCKESLADNCNFDFGNNSDVMSSPIKMKAKGGNHWRSASEVKDIVFNEDSPTKLSVSCPSKDSVVYSLNRCPMKNESLVNYLQSRDFKHATDIDRENAHFSIAETMLSALEQIKWNMLSKVIADSQKAWQLREESQLNSPQRVRVRRVFRKKNSKRLSHSEHDSDALTTSLSSSILKSSDEATSSYNFSESGSSETMLDISFNGKETPPSLLSSQHAGLSLSMASLYSDSDFKRPINALQSFASTNHDLEKDEENIKAGQIKSADAIALSLLRRFSHNDMPKASDLDWVIIEDDTPQQLLPLPDSFPISPDDAAYLTTLNQQCRFRGNLDWAPPRPQIICSMPIKPKLMDGLAKQNNRCAGCGSKIEFALAKRCRYCEYLGKYFCICCHDNDLSIIPGRILQHWDFKKYFVSHFAFEFLKQNWNEPLFNVEFAKSCYKKVAIMRKVRDLRIQLHYLAAFIQTCRDKNAPLEVITSCPSHWYDSQYNVHLYSMDELQQMQKNNLYSQISIRVDTCMNHVKSCQLCLARAFICEFCKAEDDIIFPFEIDRVTTCSDCHASYHTICYTKNSQCPKCIRIKLRKSITTSIDDS